MLTSLGMGVNGFQLQLSGPSPANYVILASGDLEHWTPISTNTVLNGLLQFTDTNATAASKRFYRAVAQKNW